MSLTDIVMEATILVLLPPEPDGHNDPGQIFAMAYGLSPDAMTVWVRLICGFNSISESEH